MKKKKKKLESKGGKLTGNLTGSIVDAKRKAELLNTIAQVEGVNPQQVNILN